MRIVMLGPYPLDGIMDTINGGVEAVVVNMIKGLSRFKDLDIHVITAATHITREMDFVLKGINIHGVPLDRRFGNITFYAKTRRLICKRIIEINPDLIHSHTFGYYTLAALDSGHRKVLVSTHGLSNSNWARKGGLVENIRHRLQDYVYLKCLNRAENIIVNSPYTIKTLSGINNKNIYELGNPVSDVFFSAAMDMEEEKRILFAGNICSLKGIMVILEALDAFRNDIDGIKVNLAGPVTDSAFYIKAASYIKEHNLGNSISFLGHLNDNELKQEYEKASIFIFPSYQDVAPLALLQAMASGKAIVASNVGGIPYIIDDSINGLLIQPGDFYSLAERIALFIRDKELRRRLGSNAQKKISGNNRIDKVTDRLYGIYESVA